MISIPLLNVSVTNKTIAEIVFNSHKSWVSSVEWSPNDPFVLASSSHDGSVKVWDIRSSLPLHTVQAHKKNEKSLCIAFTGSSIFSGGSDCMVKKFKF